MSDFRRITIILGAGASKAYARWPYPLLPNLLPEILSYADRLPGRGGRQRLYLAYALIKAHGLAAPDLAAGVISEAVIQEQFERIKALPESDLDLTTVFCKLEALPGEAATKPYWALTHAIGFYMFQMANADIDQSHVGPVDCAHAKLIALIDELLSAGITVNVVDFNYDCVLERVRSSLGAPRFGWDCDRERKVIADTVDEPPLSELVEANRFQAPQDEKKYSTWAGLIKPHGDMCTFLRGRTDVFYRGGRHSHTTSAVFPTTLADISAEDRFVRSSIMPPTNSRFRHMSHFYDQEKQRLIAALRNCDAVVIIGWSAGGTDDFYHKIFNSVFRDNSSSSKLYVVNWSPEDARDSDLENRLRKLFCNKVVFQDVQMSGFTEVAIERLEWSLFSTE